MVSPITGTGTGTAHETHAPVAAPVSGAARPAFRWYVFALLGAGLVAGIAARALAGASAGAFDARGVSAGDTAWVLTAAAFVMLMTPAVGFFYGGMVRSKNVVSVIKQSLLILSIVSLQWVLLGYTLVFGAGAGGLIGGLEFFGLRGVGYAPNPAYAPTIPQLAYMLFQGMFAIITPALIIGSFAERIRFRTLMIFVLAWTTLVYDPIAHWVWGASGWLHTLGALDFAGGTVVHISAGFAGLAVAIVVGRRLEWRQGQPLEANNVPLVLLGAALLWFGWFGFNAGSALAASGIAALAFTNTNTAAAAALLTWAACDLVRNGKITAVGAATGLVVGLVAVTPAAGYVTVPAALAIGVV